MSSIKDLVILVAEDEGDLREVYCLLIGSEFQAEFLEAENGEVAIRMIKENPKIDIIVSDFNMPKANGLDVYKESRSEGKSIPFILVTSDRLEDHPQFKNQPNTGYVQKPFSEESMFKEIRRILAKDAVEVYSEHKYVPISTSTLHKIKEISRPLYVKLGDDKFVKIVNEGSVFDDTFVDRFNQKGVKRLFVEKSDLNTLTLHFKTSVMNEMLFKGLAGRKSEAIHLSASVQELVAGSVKTFGINEEAAQLAEKNVQLVGAVLETTPEISTIFQWIDEAEGEEGIIHSMLLTYLITAMSREIEFPHKFGLEILSLASFFHDVILDENQVRNEARFINGLQLGSNVNKSDLMAVSDHMKRTIDALSPWKSSPIELPIVIAQHHEKPDGTGFPEKLSADQIHDLSAIFIVAHDLVEIYLRSKNREMVLQEFRGRAGMFQHPKFNPYYQSLLKIISSR
jgi:response regulator RpfG family c-di-GMP phosphodiesterase